METAINNARLAAQVMRERIEVVKPIARLWIGKHNAKVARTSDKVKAELKLTAIPHIFTAVGSQFSKKNTDCVVNLSSNASELSFVEEMPRSLYERVVIPLCAAFNLTNDKQAKITLNQVKK